MIVQIETSILPGAISLEPHPGDGTCGAECVFRGRVRDERHPELGDLLALDYEAYEPMASTMLKDLAEEVAREFDLVSLRIIHATGRIALGEASVLIEARAKHRAAAFEGAQAAIDRLKERLPIFKTEHWTSGTTHPAGTTPVP
jgi:molybdopterin synthase catalytic subunit